MADLKTSVAGRINYVCAECGASGVRLWREYQTFLDHITLRCRACAITNQSDKIPSGDTVGCLVPAVPTVEMDTFWGYTSVPDDRVAWWHALPETSEREAAHKLDLTHVRLHSLNCPTPDTLECECLPRASASAFARTLKALFKTGKDGDAVGLVLRRDNALRKRTEPRRKG